MSADPGSLQKALFDQDDGPDGIVLAGWGLSAVVAFVFAYSAWQYGSVSPQGPVRLPPAGDVEITGSTGADDRRVGTFGENAAPKGEQFATEITTIEIDVLRREVSELRRSVATLRELNDRVRLRLDRLDGAAASDGDITGSIGKVTPARSASPRPEMSMPAAEGSANDVTVEVRPMDPERDLPAHTAPGKSDLRAVRPEPTRRSEPVGAIAAAPPDATHRNPGAIRDVTPGPRSRGEAKPAMSDNAPSKPPAPIVALDPDNASAPERFDNPIITGSIPAAAPRALIPPSKPKASPVVPVSTPPPGALAAPDTTDPPTPFLSKSTFGVDLGGYRSFKELEAAWASFAAKNGEAMVDLTPLASMGERDGSLEVRLIAGPFANAANAMKLCAGLVAAGIACQPSLYTGQPFKEQ